MYFNEAEFQNPVTIIRPREYTGAFPNPLKGFRPSLGYSNHEYARVMRHYIKWNEIENNGKDNIDRILSFCNNAWEGVDRKNIKVIPRVYLEWPNIGKYWPEDITPGDYESPQFKRRIAGLVQKLGQAWDGDSRVAYIEMGLIGLWGEQHTPDISHEMETILGDAFTGSFKNKLIMVRHPHDFKNYNFGIYWDSFAHYEQTVHEDGIMKLGERWKTAVMGGEVAYDWGSYRIQAGDNPNDSLSDPVHREYILNRIRRLHTNHLGWIADYDQKDEAVSAGAAVVQKAFGYRFVIEEVKYSSRVNHGDKLHIEFTVKNNGSSPFYYNWPVEASLLEPSTRKPVWKGVFTASDIRTWLPGDMWEDAAGKYMIPAQVHTIDDTFTIPPELHQGAYILALAILDPAGNIPAVRFAVANYFTGGRHPIGMLGIGVECSSPLCTDSFDDIKADQSLHYLID